MGILGPKRTVLDDLAANTRGPFRTVENEFTILDRADLVMIDPVGTGFSRPIGKGEGKDFWGVDQDIRSVSDFIVRYLNQYGRWAAPKFILGESYGGMRTAGVAYELLTKHNVALNGVVLVSPYLDFGSGTAGLNLSDGDVNFLPTYAATAWYHHALADRPAAPAAFPARSRGLRPGRLRARPLQGFEGHGRGAAEGPGRPRSLHGCEHRLLGQGEPPDGRGSFSSGADA